jgi:hypothetical protein
LKIIIGVCPRGEHLEVSTLRHDIRNRLGWKGFSGTNALAYLASSSAKKKKKFYIVESR